MINWYIYFSGCFLAVIASAVIDWWFIVRPLRKELALYKRQREWLAGKLEGSAIYNVESCNYTASKDIWLQAAAEATKEDE